MGLNAATAAAASGIGTATLSDGSFVDVAMVAHANEVLAFAQRVERCDKARK